MAFLLNASVFVGKGRLRVIRYLSLTLRVVCSAVDYFNPICIAECLYFIINELQTVIRVQKFGNS